MALICELDNVIWRAADNLTQPLQSDDRDVFVLFQRIQRFVIDPALQQLILTDTMLLHCLP